MFIKATASRLKKGVKLVTKSPIRAGLIGVLAGVILAVGFIVSPMSRADNVNFSSARDCDSNAVMYCGAMTISELINKYDNNTSTKHIYSYFGITSAEIHNIKADVHAGHVHKNGNVSTGNKIVATDARTAGRLYMPGSTKVTSQGTTFYTRDPSVSFMSDKLDAYVVMKDGVFSYAILASCGNPVKAHPTTKPDYTIAKTVRTGSGSWVENTSIKYGETAEFRVVVKSTGSAPVIDLFVKDKLPSDLEYLAGSLKRDGNAANATDFFGDQGIKIAKLPQGDSVTFTFKATTKQKTQPVPCVSKKVVNLAKMDADSLAPKDDSASVDLTCTQVKHPNYKIVKQVQLIGGNDWSENVTVPSGTKVRYRIVVTSTGDVAVNNLIVGDTLPAHTTYTDNSLLKDGQAVSNDTAFFNGGINVGSLAPGKSITFVFIATAGSVKADAAECKEERLNNVAKADGDVLNPITDDASVNTDCKVCKPDYTIAKTVRTGSGSWVENTSIKYGETAEFRVVVKSTGSAPVIDLFVKDKLPSDLEYLAGSLKRDGNAANATDFFGDQGIKIAKLPQGDSVTFTFKATTKQKTQPVPCVSKKVVNLAKMDADSLAPKDDSASVDLTCTQVKHPNYKIVKQVQLIGGRGNNWSENVTVPSGTKVRYRIVVTSTGDVAVNNLIVGDTLPAHTTYTDNSLLKDGQAVSNDTAFFNGGINVGSLAPGKSITFVFIATAGSVKADAAECKEERLNNVAKADGDVLNPITDDASVNTDCKVCKPDYTIAKTVRTGSGSWVENTSIKYGETAEFRVVVKSTGSAPVIDLFVKDKLPSDLEYLAGSLKRDGNAANATDFFGDQGIKIAKLPQGDSVTFTFKATTKQKTQPVPCVSKKVVNLAKMDADSLAPKDDSASVDLTCTQVKHPNYKIVKQVQLIGGNDWSENVTVPSGTKVRYRIVVTSTGDVAVNNLIVGDTLPAHTTYTDNSLLKDGQAVSNDTAFFNGGINVGSLAPGKSITFVFIATAGSVKADAAECKEERLNNVAKADGDVLNPITDDASVNTECNKIQRYRCDLLTATSLGNRSFKFNVTYTATGGASLSTVTYNYGDNSPEYITDKTTSTYQYSKDGTFTANVKLTFMVNGQSQTVTSEGCNTTVSTSTPPKMCPIPGKEHLPENDPYCANEIVVVPEVPTEVPNTGPGSIVGLFAGSSILGTLGYRSWTIRRRR